VIRRDRPVRDKGVLLIYAEVLRQRRRRNSGKGDPGSEERDDEAVEGL